jgi:hypothetical protein
VVVRHLVRIPCIGLVGRWLPSKQSTSCKNGMPAAWQLSSGGREEIITVLPREQYETLIVPFKA